MHITILMNQYYISKYAQENYVQPSKYCHVVFQPFCPRFSSICGTYKDLPRWEMLPFHKNAVMKANDVN